MDIKAKEASKPPIKAPKPNQFQVGNAGRPVGTKNKLTPDIKVAIKNVVENRLLELNDDLDNMSPVNKWNVLLAVMKFAYPTLSATKIEADIKGDSKIEIVLVSTNVLPPAPDSTILNID